MGHVALAVASRVQRLMGDTQSDRFFKVGKRGVSPSLAVTPPATSR
jgi:hypothetical protein